MTQDRLPIRVEFAPGCFDDFEGSQEELDAMVAEIKQMLENLSLEELQDQSIDLEDAAWEVDTIQNAKMSRPTLQ